MFKLFSTLTPNYHPLSPSHLSTASWRLSCSLSVTQPYLVPLLARGGTGEGEDGVDEVWEEGGEREVEDFIHEAWLQGELSI